MDPARVNQLTAFDSELSKSIADTSSADQLFDDIADSRLEQAYARVMEAQTMAQVEEPVVQLPFIHGVAPAWPFVRARWHSSRFSDGTRYPVWYGSTELHGTICATVHHWLRFIMNSFPEHRDTVVGERQLYSVHCSGDLVDLRGEENSRSAFTRGVAKMAQAAGREGLLESSPYSREGLSAVILHQGALSTPRSLGSLRYRWNRASGEITVEHPPGQFWLQLQDASLLP